jgi:ribosomal protein S18 acetylase RimI-like enzyme
MATILRATAADADTLDRLVNSAYRGEESRKGWTTEADLLEGTRIDAEALRDLIARPGTVILMYKEDNELLGCVELRKEAGRLYLGMLSVRPATQGRGVGKALLKAAESHARVEGCETIFMTVISGREELINWYLRHGYRLTGERKPFVVPDVRWGIPKQPLEFVVLEKEV